MNELFSRLGGGDMIALAGNLLGLVAIVGGISVAIVKVVSSNRRRTRLDEMEADLKMEMIQRGMSAAEIKQVLEARTNSSRREAREMLDTQPTERHRGPVTAQARQT